MKWKLMILMTVLAFASAARGSFLLSKVYNHFMNPVLLGMLILVAAYTFTKKDFGTHTEKDHSLKEQFIYAAVISIVIDFYDGFIKYPTS